ncbi:MAG: hypothetical protein GY805_32395 [Chloroflexi bacterium]|nr:hypothetical protein [Chloroflexota bacterium]
MSVLNNKQIGHNKHESNESLSPRIFLIILSITLMVIVGFLARSFLLEHVFVLIGLLLTVIGSFALTQD